MPLQHETVVAAVGDDDIAAAAEHEPGDVPFFTPPMGGEDVLGGSGADEPSSRATNTGCGKRRKRNVRARTERVTGRKNRSFLCNQCRERLVPRAHFRLDRVARRQLSGSRKVGRDHGCKLGIATGRLSIGHQEDRIA